MFPHIFVSPEGADPRALQQFWQTMSRETAVEFDAKCCFIIAALRLDLQMFFRDYAAGVLCLETWRTPVLPQRSLATALHI